jgi:hypothetical protein
MTTGRFDWQVYFASREWALLKEQVRQRSRGHCERCEMGAYEQTHHLNYKPQRGHLNYKPQRDFSAIDNMIKSGSWFDPFGDEESA